MEEKNELENIVGICILLAADKVHLDYAARNPEELKNYKLFQREKMIRAIHYYRETVPASIRNSCSLLSASDVDKMEKFYGVPSPLYGEWNGVDIHEHEERKLKEYLDANKGSGISQIFEGLDKQIRDLESKK